jgi:hypothetical protein
MSSLNDDLVCVILMLKQYPPFPPSVLEKTPLERFEYLKTNARRDVVVPMKVDKEASTLCASGKPVELPVGLKGLIATERFISAKMVEPLIDNPDSAEMPLIIHRAGKLYVVEGLATVVAAVIRGDRSIRARVARAH